MKKISYYVIAMSGTLILTVVLWAAIAILFKIGFEMFPSYGDDTNWIIGGAMVATAFLLSLFNFELKIDTTRQPVSFIWEAVYKCINVIIYALMIMLVLFILYCRSV